MASHGPAAAVRPPEPRISRPLILHLRGDRGTANLHRVCGWISQELADRSGGGPPVAYWNGCRFSEGVRPRSRIAMWNGRGCSDSVRAVAGGEVDIAITAPVAFTAAALEGRGVFAGEPFPELRALGVVPQRDRLVVGLRKTLGITSFAQLREDKPALRLATSVHDGVNYVGLAAHEVLKRSGADITGWGGQLMEDERPSESLGHVRHLPPERSPVTYPLDPVAMGRSRSAAPRCRPLLRRADHELTARRPRCERPG